VEALIATLEKQNKEMKVELIELEIAQKMKTKATIASSETKRNCVKLEQAGSPNAQVITAATVDHWDHVTLRREQLANNNMGQVLWKWRLDNVLSGRTIVPPAEATVPSGTP
jgi:hypothetical protein